MNCNIPLSIAEELTHRYHYSAETGEGAADAIVKFFNPAGAQTWYISEGCPLDWNGEPCEIDAAEDWHLFGFCDLGMAGCAELGYVLLSQLQAVRVGPFGIEIERDIHFKPTPLAEIQDNYRRACA